MYRTVYRIALVPLLLLPVARATYFEYNDDFICEAVANIKVQSATCNGGPYCKIGDTMNTYGSVTLQNALPDSTMCITAKYCFMGVKFLCKTAHTAEPVNVCQSVGMSNSNNQYGNYGTACPSAGSFYFEKDFVVPGIVGVNAGAGWWLTAFFRVTDCNEYSAYGFECKASFKAISESALNVEENVWAKYNEATGGTYVKEGAAGVLLVSGLAYFISKKRRTAQTRRIDSISRHRQDSLIEDIDGDFEMMQDVGVHA